MQHSGGVRTDEASRATDTDSAKIRGSGTRRKATTRKVASRAGAFGNRFELIMKSESYSEISSNASVGETASCWLRLAGAAENAKLASQATTSVMRLPIKTYHVHAMLVANRM